MYLKVLKSIFFKFYTAYLKLEVGLTIIEHWWPIDEAKSFYNCSFQI